MESVESDELAERIRQLEEKVLELERQARTDHEALDAIKGAVTIRQIVTALRSRADHLSRDGQLRSGVHIHEVADNIRLGQALYGLANDIERGSS